MKKKCLTTQAKKGLFVQNITHQDIFDLTPDSGSNLPFSYFRISLPIQQYLIQQGALYVAESHRGTTKVLHTGLKRTKINLIYSGDVYDPLTQAKSLILFKRVSGANSYQVFLFEGYYPKSLTKVINEMKTL